MKGKMSHAAVLAALVPKKNTYGARFVGRNMYASINPETIMKAFLFRGEHTGYVGLNLSIINKRFGQVDSVVIPFPSAGYSTRKMLMLMVGSDMVEWDTELTSEEIAEIQEQVNAYIDAFDALPDMESAML